MLLDSATALKLAVDNEMPLLEGGPSASALWLQVRHGANTFWDWWLSGLSTMMPLGNLTSLHIDLYNASLLAVLSHTAQLANLFVRLELDKASQDGAWMWDGALVPPVAALCTMLSQSGPSNDPGVPDVVAMLSTRAGLGHPIRCLVVKAIPLSDSDLEWRPALQSYFSDQLSPLAEHIERFKECVDGDMHVCAFETWNVPGMDDYWCGDEKQKVQYTPLWSYDYSFS